MRIECQLGKIMTDRNLSNKNVVELTGVSRNTITSLAANATKRLDYDTLARLCAGLNVSISEMIVMVE